MIERPQPFAHAAPADAAAARLRAEASACMPPGLARVATGALLALALAACGPATDHRTTLDHAELRAVVDELDALARRPDRAADDLVTRVATPERIDLLFRMPEFSAQSFEVRRQALALAGRGNTLSFMRPADILERMAAWFPDRFGTPQARKGRLSTAANRLYGPYPDWNAEAAAFMVLWECMPAIAWEEPDANPFRQRPGNSSFAPLAAPRSSQREFRDCVFQSSGEADHFDKRLPRDAADARAAAIGALAAPVLQQKFDTYLHAYGCSGRGPEDCVLLLWMWSSLAPDDARLAETLRWLEPAVRPTGEPPPLSKAEAEYGPGVQETNEPRFDEAIRKAAFLRAKLTAVLHAPANWPPDARATAFQQLAQLQAWFDANVDARWQPLYALERQHEVLDPWKTLGKGTPERGALLDELDALPIDTDCSILRVWFRHGGPALQSAYALRRLRRGGLLPCDSPDWHWLARGEEADSREMRTQYLAALDTLQSGTARETIIGQLLGGCRVGTVEEWAQAACATWVSQPMTASPATHRLLLQRAVVRDWPALPVAPPPHNAGATPEAFAAQAEWLHRLIAPRGHPAAEQAAHLAAELEQRGTLVRRAIGWRHPNGTTAVIDLILQPPAPAAAADVALQGGRQLLLLEAHALHAIGVPARFDFAHDEGGIAAVTDVDGDGKPELWLKAGTGPCDSEGLKPGTDCAVATLHLGEIHGDLLSYFKDERPPQSGSDTSPQHAPRRR